VVTSLAVYPGSFDPPTVAHLAIVEAALGHAAEVRLVLSERALGKDVPAGGTSVEVRRAVLTAATRDIRGVEVGVTGARLVVDIAEEAGADAVVVGSDKWAQVTDPAWYGGSVQERDAVLARLPTVLLVRRSGDAGPSTAIAAAPAGVEVVLLELPADLRSVSSTRARAGEAHLMVEAARTSGHWS
jgi:nicotinic acid mononucleotide adenylyltransferase